MTQGIVIVQVRLTRCLDKRLRSLAMGRKESMNHTICQCLRHGLRRSRPAQRGQGEGT
jgi:hypothetical protein